MVTPEQLDRYRERDFSLAVANVLSLLPYGKAVSREEIVTLHSPSTVDAVLDALCAAGRVTRWGSRYINQRLTG